MFYGVLNHEAKPSGFRTDKTLPATLWNSFKNIPQKDCPSGVQTKVQIVKGEYWHTRKTSYANISMLYIYNSNDECFTSF